MLYSSIAAVHSVALLPGNKRTVDLDVFPTWAITTLGMFMAWPQLHFNQTLKQARKSVRCVVYLWGMLMILGTAIGWYNNDTKRGTPMPCDPNSKMGACDLICNVTLPMRDGQSVLSIPNYDSTSRKNIKSIWALPWIFVIMVFLLGLFFAAATYRKRQLQNTVMFRWLFKKSFRWFFKKSAGGTLVWVSIINWSIMGLSVWWAITWEFFMMGKPQVPLEERMSAIGQWGPLVGAFFALFAAVMKKLVDEWTAMRERNNWDGIDVELTVLTPAERHPVTLTPADFQEGVFGVTN